MCSREQEEVMANVTASIPHQLGRAEAKRRIQDQMGVLHQQPGLSFADFSGTWVDDTMNFTIHTAGQTITGQLMVEDQAVHMELVLPWLLSLMAGSIKKRIEQDVRRV